MKKIISIFSLFLICILISTSVFALELPMSVDKMNNNSSIVTVSSSEVAVNTEFYLILNLSKISYSKFKVEITNSNSLSAGEITSSVKNLSNSGVATTFTIDKSEISLEKLGIVYTSPMQEGNVKFSVKITSLDETVDTLNTKLTTLNQEISSLEKNLKELQDKLSSISVSNTVSGNTVDNTVGNTQVVDNTVGNVDTNSQKSELEQKISEVQTNLDSKNQEKTETENKINNFSQDTTTEEVSVKVSQNVSQNNKSDNMLDEKDFMMSDKEKEMSKSMEKMMSQMEGLESDLKNANDKITSLTTSVTYQGSQNNYLKSLSITGVELNSEFKKTTQNYFASVDSSITSVTVNAVAEDSSAIVTIYGNTNLESGKNKIIITVTADDGSVRNYKIYVTK